METIPVLTGNIDGNFVKVFCKYCKKKHRHGLTPDLLAGENSHRSSHCNNFDSPYQTTGYYIKLVTKNKLAIVQNTITCGK